MLRIPREIWLWPVAEPAYDSQDAKFGLIKVIFKLFCEFFFELQKNRKKNILLCSNVLLKNYTTFSVFS